MSKEKKPPKKDVKKLSEALRQNLLRRKAQKKQKEVKQNAN
ncbi:hypothetical protein [Candidatus Jidaibacter acanthamoeba]|jgi:hypothetical protein|uniref:Uncharacterized protein n=1 Tax=Candidatus Jidaibacter acanthamoebae TaxID=86105 RepID=A0A0C1QPK3_9RICK|nr:hypothetical protein [Candidatus Jidaibacter acanthamoeba]KIE05928.1 hypothetical protein NF27_CG01080 [Candidatus Jidaibacter acanthamoeba]